MVVATRIFEGDHADRRPAELVGGQIDDERVALRIAELAPIVAAPVPLDVAGTAIVVAVAAADRDVAQAEAMGGRGEQYRRVQATAR